MKTIALALVFGAATLSSGCGAADCNADRNKLAGSISELLDIEADTTQAQQTDTNTIRMRWYHSTDIVAEVIVDVRAFTKGVKIPLVNGDISRITSPETNFPDKIVKGSVTVNSDKIIGARFNACFTVLFDVTTTNNTQRTMEGQLDNTLTAVGSM
jgi:hypothetical protein